MMATTTVVDDDPSLDVGRAGVSVTAVVSALVAAVTTSAGAVSSSAGSTAGALVLKLAACPQRRTEGVAPVAQLRNVAK